MMNDPLLESCGYYCEDVFVCFLLLTCCPNQNPLRCGVALLSGKEPQTQECLNSSPGARACPAPGRTHKSGISATANKKTRHWPTRVSVQSMKTLRHCLMVNLSGDNQGALRSRPMRTSSLLSR